MLNDAKGSLIHNVRINVLNKTALQTLKENNFNFAKFINFKTKDGQTPFLLLCQTISWKLIDLHFEFAQEFIRIWKEHANSIVDNTVETDNSGNNALHFTAFNAKRNQDCFNLQYILETVFFPNKNKNSKLGHIATNQQNKIGDTPLHNAFSRFRKSAVDISSNNKTEQIVTDCVELLLKYDNGAALKYNDAGYLPIHLACKYNHWQALAVMMQKKSYDDGDNINLPTRTKDSDDDNCNALSLSTKKGYSQCVKILCENENIEIHDKSFYDAIELDNVVILKCLLRTILSKHRTNDWQSIENCTKSKNDNNKSANEIIISIEFLQKLKKHAPTNNCTVFLDQLIKFGFEKKNYNYIALSLNYNLSSIKLDDNNEKVPDITVLVNDGIDANVTSDSDLKDNYDVVEEKKQDMIGPWILHKELGNGKFGKVKLGINKKNTNDKVALKFIELGNIPTQFILTEIVTVQKIHHSNVIMLRGFNLNVFNDGSNVMIAFEYAPYGELYDVLKYCNHFSVDLAFFCFEQMVSALVACHEMNIAHRDLKPQNILIGNGFKIKIADFGLSKILGRKKTSKEKNYIVGTAGYKAPELYSENNTDINSISDKACDIFSLSIILWQMLNGYKTKPFNSCKKDDPKYKSIVLRNYRTFWENHAASDNYRIRFENNRFSNNYEIKDLFERMFEFDATKRISIQEIEKHKWILDMHSQTTFQSNFFYNSRLQTLFEEISNNVGDTKIVPEKNVNKQPAKNDNNINNKDSNNNNNDAVCYSDKYSESEKISSLGISSYSDTKNQARKIQENKQNEN